LSFRRASSYDYFVAKKLGSKDTLQEREMSRTELLGSTLAAIRRLGTEVDGLDQRATTRFGISRTDLHLIDRLRSDGPQRPSLLARSVGLTSGGLSIALDRLERIGYIHRSQDPGDRRSVLVEATEAIVPLETEVFGPLIKRMTALLDTYTDEQLATIRHYLEQAATAISQSGPDAAAPVGDASGPPAVERAVKRRRASRPDK
jgi:DNA-binding MarR family transcriptional regulator